MDKVNNRNMKTLRRIILICAICILIIIGIIIALLLNPVENRLTYIYDDNENWSITMMPKNVSPLFSEYSGVIDSKSIYKAMNIFVEDLVEKYYLKFKDDFSQAKIEKYYDENTLDINRELRIEDKETFVKFVKSLEKLKGDELVLKEYIIIPDSIKQVTRGLQFVLAVDYEGNDRILFNLKLMNQSSKDTTPISYSASESQQYMDYKLEIPENPVVTTDNVGTGKVIK